MGHTQEPDNCCYSQILLFLPFRQENFCENRTPHLAFQDNFGRLRKHADNPLINIQLGINLDQALLRMEDFAQNDSLNFDNEEEMSFNDDYLLEQNAITPAEAIRAPPTIVTGIQAIVNTLKRDQKGVFT